MHKNEVAICTFSIILIILLYLCMEKRNEIGDLKNAKELIIRKQIEFTKLSDKIHNTQFNFIKTKEELIQPNQNIKKILSQISKKSHIEKIKFKQKENDQKSFKEVHIEIQFFAECEQDIYRFIQKLANKLNIIFDSITIIKKDKRNFITHLKCRLFEFKYLDRAINITPKKKNRVYFSYLQLFPKDDEKKKHFLKGIIDKTKAYIDDEWKQVGDTIDEYEIKDITGRNILIEREGKIEKIKLGDSW